MKTINSIKEFNQQRYRRRFLIVSIQLGLLILLIGGWEFFVYKGFLNEFLLSKPSKIFSLFIEYVKNGNLFDHVWSSVYETLLGLIIGTLLGFLIATLLYLSDFISKVLEPYLLVLNSVPKTALAPIFIIWMGTNTKGIVAVSISLFIVITTLNMYSYFKSIDQSIIKMMRSFGASKTQILFKIVYPSNLSNLLSTIKVNIGLSWVGVIVGEFLVSKKGIGYLVMYGGQVFKLDLVMMGVIVLSIIAFFMFEIVNLLELFISKRKKHHKKNKPRMN